MNWNIVGHEWAVQMLQKHILQDQVRHAYLFSGPDGIGRRTLALRFVQSLNCLSKHSDGSPCGTCRVCRQVMQMQHPDLTVVTMEEDKSAISVEQIRDLQHILSRSPYESRYRVGLMLDFDKATDSAQNALLKTLEEAPSQAILIMTVDTVESMLPTIVSRCEILRLRAVKVDQLGLTLVNQFQLAPQKAQFLAHISGGRIGEALTLVEDTGKLDSRKQWMDDLLEMIRSDCNNRLDYAEKKFRYAGRDSLRDACKIWMTFWRDMVISASGEEAPLLNPDFEQDITSIGKALGLQTVREQSGILLQTMTRLEANVNVWMLAEVLMLDLPVMQ